MTDQNSIFNAFYDPSFKSTEIKLRQDCLLLKYTESNKPKRSRLVNMQRGEKNMVVKYFLTKKLTKEKIYVCQKAFLDTFRLSKNRVQGVVNRHFVNGSSPIEKRGGDRRLKIYELKMNAVVSFIKQFKVIESHYCRSKTAHRQYLQSELNIRKMWRMYNEQADDALKVKQSYFRHVFRTKFNIGFGSPRTDECSTCVSLLERIKNCKDPNIKKNLIAEQSCHKLKAKSFYNMLKEKRENLITISFDCQKNQVLPRVQDQSAYYSRQLYKYNLTIVIGDSKAKQTVDNVFIYEYDESEHKKGSNEVSSAVYDCLNSLPIPNTVNVLRVMSDGCGGQNKNTTMMGMLSYWIYNNAPANIQQIEYIFPVVGHSFLPSDRVFARIEKAVKDKNIIVNPNEYSDIFKQFGTVRPLAGKVFNWKDRCSEIFKAPGRWHFKFNLCKRFFFKVDSKKTNVLLKGEVHYRTEVGKFGNVCVKGETVGKMNPPEFVPPGIKVAPLKLRDVILLLRKHFGEEWEELESLSYYKKVSLQKENGSCHEDEDEECRPTDLAMEVEDLVV